MNTSLIVLAAGALALLLVLWALAVASRLDRLHIRTDAAWAALDGALARRAVVARAVATSLGGEVGTRLRRCGEDAERAQRGEREAAENELSRQLANLPREGVPDPLLAELADSEQRVVIARRVHNDAVRDTLALRQRRAVSWLRFAGTAPSPAYFEIAEPTGGDTFAAAPSSEWEERRDAG